MTNPYDCTHTWNIRDKMNKQMRKIREGGTKQEMDS